MSDKIFPLNLTAMAALAEKVKGNPVTTRMESGVANCFPGLEFDHRNLDRRFFPGLAFEFVSSNQLRSGARLVQANPNDPDLDPSTFEGLPADAPDPTVQSELQAALAGDQGNALQQGAWFLDSITQSGKTIAIGVMAGMTAWRLVRSLEPGPVKIVLGRRRTRAGEVLPNPVRIALSGWRRRFVSTRTGVISEAYQPGELTQSLCSPWTHDFRDCACTYWASNHPDVVLAEEVPGAPPDPKFEETPIDWLRSDRALARTADALGTESANRPAQMDHYEINKRWQDLAIVLAGHEVSRIFAPHGLESANPFATPDELAAKLVDLAKLEHAVMLEYLYAMYSVRNPRPGDDQALADALTFARHEILVVAVSEMRHLRWANQLIWEMEHAGNLLTKKFGPSLGVAATVPVNGPDELPPRLRPLTPDVLDDFIAVEKPSGTLDGAYAQVLATLRDPKYPPTLEQLAARILGDGEQHFMRFREIQRVLGPFSAGNPPAYLQPIQPAPASNAQAKAALALYHTILDDLSKAYDTGDMENADLIAAARTTMFTLKDAADKLANAGLGVPYF